MSSRAPHRPSAEPTIETLSALAADGARFGERTAIIEFGSAGRKTLSYAELATLAAETAGGFLESGVVRGDRVVLLGPNTIDWIISYFAVVMAGGVAVPLDPQAATEATASAIVRAAPRAIVTTAAQRDALAPRVGGAVRFWLLDDVSADGITALRRPAALRDLPRVDPHDTAALLFTSGTTGTPKGVTLTHANIAANVNELLTARLIEPDARVLLPLPLHHTYPFTVGLLMTLALGAAVVLPAGISGPEILAATVAARATALLAVPRLCAAVWDGVESSVRNRGVFAARAFRALLTASVLIRRHTGLRAGRYLFRRLHDRFGGALDVIGCGGAKLASDLALNLEGLGFRVLTGYGLTETSPVLTFNSPGAAQLGSEGRPLPGVDLRIANTQGSAVGEIVARGPNVFAGYWNDPQATADAFTDDGWFRTGDLGYIDERGYLHVVGRTKELLVLADGKKFFPEPVEKVYAKSPLVKELGVFERDGQLAAVIVPDEDAIRARGALREAALLRDAVEDAAAELPPYQRITSYRVVRSPLPRTQLGKLRRHLLPGLFAGGEGRPRERSALTEADRALLDLPLAAKVWRWLGERYPTQPLSLDTSPQLELGIDSLGWVTLTAELDRQFGVALRAERLACILTLRDLLCEVETAGASRAPSAPAPDYVPPGPVLRLLGALLFAAVRLLARIFVRARVTGLERLPPGPVLIAPNHASYLDPIVIAAALPWARLRQTYWAGWVGVLHKTPLRRLVSRAAQVFPVDPDRDLAAAVRTARELLEHGSTVVWFPEGRRSPDGRLQPFRPGIGALLEGSATRVVPAAITGTFAAWPRHERWPRRAPIEIVFGEPLAPDVSKDPDAVRHALERTVEELFRRTSRLPDPTGETP